MPRHIAFYPILMGVLVFCALSCTAPKNTITIAGKITEDTHWSSDTIYILDGSVIVTQGATLTIDPGTLIKAMPGEMPKVSMLIIAQDGKINAKGTAEQPIVFTAADDNITSVHETSLLQETAQGLWGGVIVLGDAPITTKFEEDSTFYVGLNPNDQSSYYGGNNTDHDAGVLEYISIRHGGANIGTGSDSNGLTLCGVGAKTTINNIEVYANQDDGVEFFGGSANASNILVYHQGDDGIDIDEGYTGTIENVKVVLGPYSDSGIEINPGSDEQRFHLINFDVIGQTDVEGQSIVIINPKSTGTIDGLSISNFSSAAKMFVESTAVNISNVVAPKGVGNEIVEGAGKSTVKFSGAKEQAESLKFSWTRSQ